MNKSKTKFEILSEMSKLIHYFADLVEDLANEEESCQEVEVQAEVVEKQNVVEQPSHSGEQDG